MLKENPDSRRIVLNMWSAQYDLGRDRKDLPCNTNIYFRVTDGKLNMTVCNRSNDLVWGMLGANVVHMTLLQEFIAAAAGLDLGNYTVMTNNLHLYTKMPNIENILRGASVRHVSDTCDTMFTHEDNPIDLIADCVDLCNDKIPHRTHWMRNVAVPMYMAYLNKEARQVYNAAIQDSAWAYACQQWTMRRAYG
jgi:hypothetical protein